MRACRGSSRRPRAPSSSAGPESAVASSGRPSSSHAVSAACGRLAERHGALLVALAEHAQQPPGPVDVVDVEPAQLADTNSGGVQQLNDQLVAQCERIALLCTGFGGGHGVERLILSQHSRQSASGFGYLQPRRRITRQQPPARRPRGEGLDRRRASRQRSARRACRRLNRQPGPKDRQGQPVQSGAGHTFGEKAEQRAQVAQVRAAGVVGAAALQREKLVELLEHRPQPRVASLLPAGVHSPTVADRRRRNGQVSACVAA